TVRGGDGQAGILSPRETPARESQKGEQKANRHSCQFKNALISLKTKGAKNPNSHSKRGSHEARRPSPPGRNRRPESASGGRNERSLLDRPPTGAYQNGSKLPDSMLATRSAEPRS